MQGAAPNSTLPSRVSLAILLPVFKYVPPVRWGLTRRAYFHLIRGSLSCTRTSFTNGPSEPKARDWEAQGHALG